MRKDIVWWCRQAIDNDDGIPSCWEQFPYHDISVLSYQVLASPVINLHDTDEFAGDPEALLEHMHSIVECHLAAAQRLDSFVKRTVMVLQ